MQCENLEDSPGLEDVAQINVRSCKGGMLTPEARAALVEWGGKPHCDFCAGMLDHIKILRWRVCAQHPPGVPGHR